MNLNDKRILIHGVGMSNVAVVKYLLDAGAKNITVTDLKNPIEVGKQLKEIEKLCSNVRFVLGRHEEKDFTNCDLIVRNPSIPLNNPLLQKALNKGVLVETDVSLFFKLSPTRNIIGITGTKGKTTTATFLTKVLKDQGYDVVMAGNMGIPVMDLLKSVTSNTWCVLELSSFMVESLSFHKISPHIAVFTSLFPDHLNSYKSFEEYVNSKKGLFQYQTGGDFTFINSTDKELLKFCMEVKALCVRYSYRDIPKNTQHSFKGKHYKNILGCGFALAKYLSLDVEKVKISVAAFDGVEHRMESMGVVGRIEFINNSAATNPGAFVADINEILKFGKPVYLLAGGADKKLDMSEISEIINESKLIKGVVLFQGIASDKLKESICKRKLLAVSDSMSDAFGKIVRIAEKGDRDSFVFLNPGCASFGVFENEFDRGTQFKQAVMDYTAEIAFSNKQTR